jgi:hypothetical protein
MEDGARGPRYRLENDRVFGSWPRRRVARDPPFESARGSPMARASSAAANQSGCSRIRLGLADASSHTARSQPSTALRQGGAASLRRAEGAGSRLLTPSQSATIAIENQASGRTTRSSRVAGSGPSAGRAGTWLRRTDCDPSLKPRTRRFIVGIPSRAGDGPEVHPTALARRKSRGQAGDGTPGRRKRFLSLDLRHDGHKRPPGSRGSGATPCQSTLRKGRVRNPRTGRRRFARVRVLT